MQAIRRLLVAGLTLLVIGGSVGLAGSVRADSAPPGRSGVAAAGTATAGVITGVVRAGDTGAGLPDVEVDAYPVGVADLFGDLGEVADSTTTDSKGRYRLTGLDPGVEYRVRAAAREGSPYVPVYAPGTPRSLSAALVTAPGSIDVRLPRGQAVTGVLRNAQGAGDAEGDVMLLGADDANLRGSARPDAEGRWRAYVLPGRYVVGSQDEATVWFAPGVDDVRKATVLSVSARKAPPPLTMRAPRPARVDVTMVDALSGRPVPGSCASAGYEDFDPESAGPGSASGIAMATVVGLSQGCTGSSGRQTITVDPGSGLVDASGPGHVETLTRAPGTRRGVTVPLTVALPVAGSIEGRVIDDAGRALPACVEAEKAGAPRSFFPLAFTCLGPGAVRFTLEGLAPGRYRLRVGNIGGYPDRYAPDADSAATARVYTVAAGKALDIGTVRLRRGGAVAGRVLDASGRPVVGATVVVPGARWWDDDVSSTVTDAKGRYLLPDLPAGATRVRVLPPRHTGLGSRWLGGTGSETGATTVRVRLRRTTTAPDVRMVKGATLRVGVRGADPTVAVEAFDAHGRAVGFPAVVGKDGTAVVTGLPATAVRVHAWSSSVVRPAQGWFGGTSFRNARSVSLHAGRTTSVELPLRVVPATTLRLPAALRASR